ncbi:acyl transferase/acyl hydrolase/lysophospholipase [Aspergillus udagawae]|uniref:Acyl transferase/acyl hydrolase/lysophospholipase n=1 Tax=Aspergillus udagawae TaxID=91492 RepID=A0A8H3XRG0_9EURO|nr:acyl transferase/acyl hydrolase/lysophospholipase [Aspergillus udagawae]
MDNVKAPDICLLSLDGGGVRGLSSLFILQRLMRSINALRRYGAKPPLRPYEVFDLIGGTSTGGIIAIMLGRLKMDVDDCIKAYQSLSAQVFSKKHSLINWGGAIQGRFDTQELENCIKNIVKNQGMPEDVLMRDTGDSPCKVFVCAITKRHNTLNRLRTYESKRGMEFDELKVWEAARATSAATGFFDALDTMEESFIDGAPLANNPIMEIWNEAGDIWSPIASRIKCLVSIGTGRSSLEPFRDSLGGIVNTLAKIATDTERKANEFAMDKRDLLQNQRYFRFNVDRGLDQVGLEEVKKIQDIRSATAVYLEDQNTYLALERCVGLLGDRGSSTATNPSRGLHVDQLTPRIPLIVRQSFRNGWERNRPAAEELLSKLLEKPWSIEIDINAIYPFIKREDHGDIGNMINT